MRLAGISETTKALCDYESRQKHMSHFCVKVFLGKISGQFWDTHTHTEGERCYSRILFCINKDSTSRGAAKNMQIHLRSSSCSSPKDISDDNLPARVHNYTHTHTCTCVTDVCVAFAHLNFTFA